MKEDPSKYKRINKDDIRLMLHDGVFSKDNEELTRIIADDMTRTAIMNGYDVILDNTHLVPATVKKVHKLAEKIGDVRVVEKAFNVPIAECLRRNALREGFAKVPDSAILGMAKGSGLDRGKLLQDRETYYPSLNAGVPYVQDASLPLAIICDLDGTLALMGNRSPYDATHCDRDKPNVPVIDCVKAMYNSGMNIVFMSGREDKFREPTIRFIEKYVTEPCVSNCHTTYKDEQPIPYELHMRSTGDMRKDSIVKRELFDANVANKYYVMFCLDDRNQVVDFWRSIGLTCFQVAEGDF
jgi:predicted kinase